MKNADFFTAWAALFNICNRLLFAFFYGAVWFLFATQKRFSFGFYLRLSKSVLAGVCILAGVCGLATFAVWPSFAAWPTFVIWFMFSFLFIPAWIFFRDGKILSELRETFSACFFDCDYYKREKGGKSENLLKKMKFMPKQAGTDIFSFAFQTEFDFYQCWYKARDSKRKAKKGQMRASTKRNNRQSNKEWTTGII